MKINKAVVTLCLILALFFIIAPCEAQNQWFGTPYTLSISLSSYTPSNASGYDYASLWKKLAAPSTTPFTNPISIGSGSIFGGTSNNQSNNFFYSSDYSNYNNLTQYSNNLNRSYSSPNNIPPYPLKNIFFDNIVTINNDTTDDTEYMYPIAIAGNVSAIINDSLVTCIGKMILEGSDPEIIYAIEVFALDDASYTKIAELQIPSESNFYETEKVKKLIIDDNFAYILTTNPTWLYIVDLTDIENPELINGINLDTTSAEDMEIRKGWAFIATSDSDSVITSWDISDPENISLVPNYIVVDGWVNELFIDQEVLITIGDTISGLNIIDISVPYAMEILAHYDVSGQAVWMTGGGILTAGGDNNEYSRVRILNYKNFEGPTPVSAMNLLGEEEVVCAQGNVVYILTYTAISNRSRVYTFLLDQDTLKPELLKTLKVEGRCQTLQIYDHYLVTQRDDQILLWDITSPGDPEEMSPVTIDFAETVANQNQNTSETINEEKGRQKNQTFYFESFNGNGLPFNQFCYEPSNPFSYPSYVYPYNNLYTSYTDFSAPWSMGSGCSFNPLLDLFTSLLSLGMSSY